MDKHFNFRKNNFCTVGITGKIPHPQDKKKKKWTESKPHFGHFLQELYQYSTVTKNIKNKKAIKTNYVWQIPFGQFESTLLHLFRVLCPFLSCLFLSLYPWLFWVYKFNKYLKKFVFVLFFYGPWVTFSGWKNHITNKCFVYISVISVSFGILFFSKTFPGLEKYIFKFDDFSRFFMTYGPWLYNVQPLKYVPVQGDYSQFTDLLFVC